MADSKPGDGKSSPFGNGAGGAGGGSSVSGNNFVTNPSGSGNRGKGPGVISVSRTQQKKDDYDLSPAEIPEGGLLPFMDPPDDPGNPIGERPPGGGSSRKPFKLGG